MSTRIQRAIPVLFLCRDAEARGPMAEAVLAALGHGRYEAVNAAFHPGAVHQLAVEVMNGRGIDLHRHHAVPLRDLLGRSSFAHGIILAGADERDAPRIFPGAMAMEKWEVARPEHDTPAAFNVVYDRLLLLASDWVAAHAADQELVMVGH